VEHFNLVTTSLFSLILAPFSALSPVWSLVLVSVVAGVILALVYGKVSNQRALKNVKRYITAGIYESVLFRHDLPTSLRAQAGMLWGGVRYFAIAIPPILILLVPSLVILAQLNLRYGARVLEPGEKAVLTVTLKSEDALFEAEAKASDGLTLTPPLRDLDNLQVSWRLDLPQSTSTAAHNSTLTLTVSGASASQPIYRGSQPPTLPTELHTSSLWQFLYPGGSVPEALRSYVRSITVTYPEQTMLLAGMNVNWLVLFVCLSIASGFAASKVFGIEI
jgi:hypothetical protein